MPERRVTIYRGKSECTLSPIVAKNGKLPLMQGMTDVFTSRSKAFTDKAARGEKAPRARHGSSFFNVALCRTRLARFALLSSLVFAVACETQKQEKQQVATTPSTALPTQTPSGELPTHKSEKIDLNNPEACVACHAPIVAEWKTSMHSQAHHKSDPIYAGIRKIRSKKEGADIQKLCAGCHHPRELNDLESTIAHQGVSCVSCHAVSAVDPKKRGAQALTWATPGTLSGVHETTNGMSSPHKLGAPAPHLKDGSSICLACHGELIQPNGVPICTTGSEHKTAKGTQTCVECHMPVVTGSSTTGLDRASHRAHIFLGPRRLYNGHEEQRELLGEKTIELQGELKGVDLSLSLKNLSAHSVPTGFPGRQAFIEISAQKGDKEIWTKSVPFTKSYVDKDGKPTIAPFSVALKSDTRLKPGETRQLEFKLPAPADRVSVKLVFRALPTKLAKKLGLADSNLNKPQVLWEKTITP